MDKKLPKKIGNNIALLSFKKKFNINYFSKFFLI